MLLVQLLYTAFDMLSLEKTFAVLRARSSCSMPCSRVREEMLTQGHVKVAMLIACLFFNRGVDRVSGCVSNALSRGALEYLVQCAQEFLAAEQDAHHFRVLVCSFKYIYRFNEQDIPNTR